MPQQPPTVQDLLRQFSDLTVHLSGADPFSKKYGATLSVNEPNPFINGPIIIVQKEIDPEMTVRYMSPNILNLGLEIHHDARSGWKYIEYIHDDDRKRVQKELDKAFASGKNTCRLFYRLTASGYKRRWVEDFVLIIREPGGQPSYITSFIMDLSQHRNAEDRFRILFEIARTVNSAASLQELLAQIHLSLSEIMYAENFYVAIYDETTDRVSFPYFVDQFDSPPAPRQKRKGLTEYVLNTGQPCLFTAESIREHERQGLLKVIGTPPLCWMGIPLKQKDHTIGVMVLQSYDRSRVYNLSDMELISALADEIAIAIERKQAEKRFNEQSEWFKVTLGSIGDAVIACDINERIIFMNPVAEKLTGWTKNEAIGRNVSEVFRIESENPDWPVQNPIKRVLAEGTVVGLANHTVLITRDGRRISIDDSGAPIRNEQLELIGVVLVFCDITERRKTERALRVSEAKYRSIFENIAEGIYQVSPDGTLLTANPAFARITGIPSADEAVRRNAAKSVFANEEDFHHINQLTLLSGNIYHADTVWKHADGTSIDVHIHNRAITDDAGQLKYYEATVEDVTRQRNLERQLLQTQKMDFIGSLAGGIAHDFNNMITVIRMNVQLAKIHTHQPERIMEFLEQIATASQRAEQITRKLLTFSRPQMPQLATDNLNHTVQTTLKMLQHVMPASVEIHQELDPGLMNSSLDATQMEQVLLNLCLNARDAMPNGGSLWLRSCNVLRDDERLQNLLPAPVASDYVCVTVQDTGSGMPEEVRRRMFEPFFTTKEKGKGTGLGLSMCYSIVKSHNGFFNVESTPGFGTTIELYLPAIRESIHYTARDTHSAVPRGQECILLVEDNADICRATKLLLESAGYVVVEALDGDTATAAFEAQPHRFDLVFIDNVLPKKSGWAVFQRIRSLRPDITALFTSGFSLTDQHLKDFRDQNVPFIPKPYAPDNLLSRIRELIGNRKTRNC